MIYYCSEINRIIRSFILEIENKNFEDVLGKENEILVLMILHFFVICFQNETSHNSFIIMLLA